MQHGGGEIRKVSAFLIRGYSEKVPTATGRDAGVEFAFQALYKGGGRRREQQEPTPAYFDAVGDSLQKLIEGRSERLLNAVYS